MCLLCCVGICERVFKKMHSNEDLDCKNFADRLGDWILEQHVGSG